MTTTGTDDARAERAPILSLRGVSKHFGGTQALSAVDLDIEPGEVHALVGHNGSGKSTLIKILSGYHRTEPGAVARWDGEPFDLSTRHDQLRFVHQELGLVNELSAMDNLALSHGFARGPVGNVDWPEQERRTRALVERFALDLDPRRPLSEATPVQRLVVAVAAALQGWDGNRGVLVLDEPTAVLPPNEVTRLFEVVRELQRGGAAVLYVSHRLDEIFRIADRVTVLRAGRRVTTRPVQGLSVQSLAELMVGADVEADRRFRDSGNDASSPADPPNDPVLEVRELTAGPLRGVDFALARGEVLGIAGLAGSGRETLPYAVAGAYIGKASGSIRIPGVSEHWIDASRADRLGLPVVPADRTAEGVIKEFSVAENLTLPLLSRVRSRAGAVHRAREAALADAWIGRAGIRTATRDAPITALSGGNQQKVVMARALAQSPRVLILCEPTAGVDIGARHQLYSLIEDQVREGSLSVIVSSSDIGDLFALCTRVLVLRDGLISRELRAAEITEASLIHAMEGSA